MGISCFCIRSYDVARKLDLASSGNGLDADGVKLFCGAMGKHVADRAIQVRRRRWLAAPPR